MSAAPPLVATCAACLVVALALRPGRPGRARRHVGVDTHGAPPPSRARRLIAADGGSLLFVVVAAVAVGAGAAAVLATGAVAQRALAPRRRERRRRRAVGHGLPDTLDLLAVNLEAGHLPIEAIRVLRPFLAPELADAFGEVLARHERGERTAGALAALPERLGTAGLGLVDALVQTDRAGLAFGPAVERLASEARAAPAPARRGVHRELPVRLSFPLVACTLPTFVLVAIVPSLIGALSSIRVG